MAQASHLSPAIHECLELLEGNKEQVAISANGSLVRAICLYHLYISPRAISEDQTIDLNQFLVEFAAKNKLSDLDNILLSLIEYDLEKSLDGLLRRFPTWVSQIMVLLGDLAGQISWIDEDAE